MNKTIINYVVIIPFLLCSSPSFSMMDCNGSGFYCDDYKNGTILCRPTSFTCKYQPEDQWSWAATGMTYAFASAVFSVTLDRIVDRVTNYYYPAKLDRRDEASKKFESTLDSDIEMNESTHLKSQNKSKSS
jgi:hypothetical protein